MNEYAESEWPQDDFFLMNKLENSGRLTLIQLWPICSQKKSHSNIRSIVDGIGATGKMVIPKGKA